MIIAGFQSFVHLILNYNWYIQVCYADTGSHNNIPHTTVVTNQ